MAARARCQQVRPNPSLEWTATGKPPWPRGALCLSSASRPRRLTGVRPSAQTLGRTAHPLASFRVAIDIANQVTGDTCMFSHVMVGTNDIERSKRFYDAVLAVLGAGEPFRILCERANQRRDCNLRQRRNHRLQMQVTRAGAAVPRRSARPRRHIDRTATRPTRRKPWRHVSGLRP